MSDIGTQLRRISGVYDASYPPSVLGGSGGAPDPHIDSITPTSGTTGMYADFDIVGSNFESTSVVEVDIGDGDGGRPRGATTFIDASHLSLGYTVFAGPQQLTVRNESGMESNSVTINGTALADEPTAALVDDRIEDLCAHGTVEAVKAHVAQYPDQIRAALDAERAGKNRSTLIGWLEDFETDLYPATGAEGEG